MDSIAPTPLVTDRKGRKNPWTKKQLVGRLLWAMTQATLFRWSPHPMYAWRAMLLRLFGAKLGNNVLIRPTVKVTIPWNLQMGEQCSVGDFAILYCLGKVTIGKWVSIAQYAHICAGTHDATSRQMHLLTPPITLGDDVWIAADAFVGPGVTVGARSIVGARGCVFKDVAQGVVVGGNPAKFIKTREFTA